jgi:hypothetical protein
LNGKTKYMTEVEIVDKILTSRSPQELFGDLSTWETSYKSWAKQIHPDFCTVPKATQAMTRLNQLKDELKKGKKHKDDAGVATYTLKSIEIIGDKSLLCKSVDNFKILKETKDLRFQFFKKYLPQDMSMVTDRGVIEPECEVTLSERAIPLSSVGTLPPEHATWVLNRLLEFCAGLNQLGYVHCGLTPDSVYIVPETHGIVIVSFYHMVKIDAKLKTISALYSSFYPQQILNHKKATTNIDTDTSKRICIYLLGDRSGSGVKLRKSTPIQSELLNFLQKSDLSPYNVGMEYVGILRRLYPKKKYLELNV